MFVTFFDTCMVSLAAMFVWRISPWWILAPWLTIACLDGVYLSSALTKVPDGAWFTITLASILTALFILWRFGKEQQWAAEAADRFPTTHFVKKQDDGFQLTEKYGGGTLTTIKAFGIFFDKSGATTPPVFSQFVIKLVAAPEVIVLFHLRPLETPSVPPENRYTVSRLAIRNGYRLIVRHGYNDVVITPDLASLVREQIQNFIRHSNDQPPALPTTISASAPPDGHHAIVHFGPTKPLTPDTTTPYTSTTPSSSAPTDTEPPDPNPQNAPAALPYSSNTITDPLPTADLPAQLAHIEAAYAHQVLYIIGKEEMKLAPHTGLFRKVLLLAFLWIRDNTRTKIASLKVPTDRVFEVGFVKDI